MAATLGPVLVALASAVFAFGETTLVGGGLTALPTVTLGPNLLANGAASADLNELFREKS